MPAAPPPGPSGSRAPLFVALGLGAIAVLVVLLIVLTGDDSDPEQTSTQTTSGPTTTPTREGGDTTAATGGGGSSTGGGSSSASAGVEVVETGFSNFRSYTDDLMASYGVILENTGDEAVTGVQVSVALYDADDTVVGTGSHSVAVLRPGDTIGLGDTPLDTLSAEVTSVEVQVGESGRGNREVPEGAFTTEGINVTSDEYRTEATFTVESTYGEQVDSPYVYAVFRNAGGEIVGGAFSFLDFVPANGRVAGNVSSFEAIPDATDADVYVDHGFL